jgi:hypothetical protein
MAELSVLLRGNAPLRGKNSEQSLISIKVGGHRNRYGEYRLSPRPQDAAYN